MGKLFLASYFSGVKALFSPFAENDCFGKKVVFIPTASLPEKVTFYVGSDKKTLGKLGMIVDELEISTASQEEIENKIAAADYVFVEGGNTFFLLQELKRTGADKLIIEHIHKGKPYVGASAGAMILSRDIEYVQYMDDPSLAPALHGDFSALSIVDFCVVPHFTNVPFKKAGKRIVNLYGDTLDLRPISNSQAVIVDGDTIETVSC
jgi:dipeptidase E